MRNLVPRSLTLKLVLAFLIVSLTGVVLAMLYARQATVREFDRLLLQRLQSDFVTDLTTYYQETNSWGGVIAYMREEGWHVQTAPFEEQLPRPPEGGQPGEQPAPSQWQMFQFMLVDQNGIVVLPNRMHNVGEHLTSLAGLEEGVQIEVDGVVVGTVFATGSHCAAVGRVSGALSHPSPARTHRGHQCDGCGQPGAACGRPLPG